ncbi:cellulose synthase family protein [Agaribacter flavus]|uniref:Glycosyltransferase n=1 Tax=Agaribacter flavus TaxID=1902781 RepID=A0ABV7FS34_9ALTE
MILETLTITVYTLSVLLIFAFSLCQLNLLFNYLSASKRSYEREDLEFDEASPLPTVTIQLPIYNEKYVVQRLLDNIASLDYPRDKLEVQVLDDSTDSSIESTRLHIAQLQKTGLDIQHHTRCNREGFKAGALKEGLKSAKGEFIAIFDADFLPAANWLKLTLPYFKDPKIGVVQTRWAHLNKDYSLLTKVQAFALDAHFTLEQVGRNSKGHFINFNGTAGVWRKQCIEDAGNWEGDTLTEDLDLSYRAQLKQWKFKYLEQVETPAELPVAISAARSQQFRWNKGGAENFQKMRDKLFAAEHLPLRTKWHGLFHLLSSSMFLNVLIVALLSVPMLYMKNEYAHLHVYFYVMSFFVISTVIFFVCYWYMFKQMYGGGIRKFCQYIGMFFTFFSIAMGFSLHNSIAVIQGHLGKRSEFIRTPKFNVSELKEAWKDNVYLKSSLSKTVIAEGLLMLYFAFGLYSAFVVGDAGGDFGLFPFHLMLFCGFGFVFFKSIFSRG